ncbi:MAG: lysophospholipid acyltransferase family protein [Candidatus Aminicenantales bacterium]|jgi:1-acyl-sn-glycerol-3-phosphate acyltransferase
MKWLFDNVRSTLIWIIALPAFFISCVLIMAVSLFTRGPKFDAVIKFCCRTVLFCCGIRVKVQGRKNFDPHRQYIIMMNHVNFFDPFVFYAGYPGRARGIEEQKHFKWPVYGPVIKRIGQIPVDRKNSRKARESLNRAAALVRERRDFSFLVLPEGTRTRDGRLGPFKRGGFVLAIESGLDILPIVQLGAFRINRKGSRLLRPGRINYIIEAPVPIAGMVKEHHDDLVAAVRVRMLAHLEERPPAATSMPPA